MKQKNMFIYMAVFITVLTQAPLFREKLGIDTQLLMLPFWGIALLATISTNKSVYVAFTKNYYILFLTILFGCILLSIITGENYFSNFTITIGMALFIFFIGNQNGEMLYDSSLFMKVCKAYCMASLILAVDIYIEYLSDYSLQTIDYVYRAKNSAGQILLSAAVFMGYLLKDKKWKILKLAIIGFFLIEIVLLRSRATILSALLIPAILLMSSTVKNKYKYTIVGILAIVITFFVLNERAFNLMVNNVLFNSTKSVDFSALNLDRVTSNRYSLLSSFPEQISGHELTGLGSSFYVDNLFVNAIGNYGVFFGLLVTILSLLPIMESFFSKFKNRSLMNGEKIVLRIIFFTYTFNGLFEAWAPLGPGGKCFIFWLLLGMLYSGYRGKVAENA